MGAVDDVMPTAYGESFDIISGTNDAGLSGTNVSTQSEVLHLKTCSINR